MMQNASECVNLIVKSLKKHGMQVHKNYEKKQKPATADASTTDTTTHNTHPSVAQIYNLLDKVEHYEVAL